MSVRSELVTTGRTAKTKGVSLRPDELADVRVIEEATGMGLTEVYRRHLAPQIHAAAQLLGELRDAGMELDRARLRTEYDITITPAQLTEIYSAESTVAFGD
jgi:hypothetical protein